MRGVGGGRSKGTVMGTVLPRTRGRGGLPSRLPGWPWFFTSRPSSRVESWCLDSERGGWL